MNCSKVWHPEKDGFKASALTSPPTRFEPLHKAA